MDDIHSHWESYFRKYGVLANAPYSKFQTMEGWDAVYTWDSLRRHEPTLTDTYTKKVARSYLMVVVAPTTTEICDDYFLNKLHEPSCVKRRSVYYGAKVVGKRSHMQVVICPYCGVLSQNAPSGCSHIRRHLGLAFACGGCRLFRTEAPKKLQEHLGKCKEALAAKAVAELTASKNEASKELLEASTSVTPSLPYGGARVPRHFCLFQPRTGRQDLHAQQSRRQSLHGQQLVTLEMSILSIFPFYDSC